MTHRRLNQSTTFVYRFCFWLRLFGDPFGIYWDRLGSVWGHRVSAGSLGSLVTCQLSCNRSVDVVFKIRLNLTIFSQFWLVLVKVGVGFWSHLVCRR